MTGPVLSHQQPATRNTDDLAGVGCPACGALTSRKESTAGDFRVQICIGCGLRWITPPPTAEDLRAYYANKSSRPYPSAVARKKFARPVRLLRKLLHPPVAILDVGCSHGQFLEELRSDGFERTGIDPETAAVAHAREEYGIEAYATELTQFVTTRKFDAITILSTLEHTGDPLGVVREAARRLRPGGLLIISTPRSDGLIPELSRRVFAPRIGEWEFVSPPSHVFYFGRRSLLALLARAGFTDVQLHFEERSRDYKRGELRKVSERHPQVAPWIRLLYEHLYLLRPVGRLSGAGDMMIATARWPS